MKIGSLFDGSGGFPLAATLCGGRAVWASEVEPYPIAVTRSRFPEMIHLGDVSKIRGDQIEPVDVITFGSPCQDLSVAGKRAGLKHTENGDDETTRSGLFMEAVRIIREMREATNGNYPKYALWENVPGAFSSNKGEDFRIVLEELIKTVEPTAVMPPVPKNGWAYADYFCGDGWSLAWRVLDAQYIRTAQRRRRIYLVLDLRAERAGEILFERESLRGYSAEIGAPWQETARNVGSGTEATDRERNGVSNAVCYGICSFASNAMLSDNPHSGFYEAKTSRTLDLNGGNPACNQGGICVVEPVAVGGLILDDLVDIVSAGFKANQGAKAGGIGWEEEKACTLNAGRPGLEPSVCMKVFRKGTRPHSADEAQKWEEADVTNTLNTFDQGEARANELVVEQHLFENHSQDSRYRGPLDVCPMLSAQMGTGGNNQPVLCMAHGQAHAEILEEKCPCLNCNHEQPIVLDRAFYNQGENALYEPQFYTDGTVPTLVAKGPSAVCVRYIVRRLTPTECARLQGFPDRWGDIDPKEDFTDEEYRFWLEVRNTHAAINGKTVKDYTKKQMLTWYNKLHTDSAEYKMWGNGIALPCALYVMQGIQDALEVDE